MPATDDFAITLHGVPIAEMEKRAGDKDRQVDGDTLPKTAIVHIAAVCRGGRCRDGLTSRWGDTETADHRFERERELT